LFPGEGPDSCLDRDCYSAKIDRHIARAVEQKPDLIQISSSWGSRNGGPLGRNRFVEVTLAKNGSSGKATPIHKRCAHLSKGIIVEGGSRGQILSICAEPSCAVHHAQTQQSRQAEEKVRVERQKQNDARKLELTKRHRIVAAVVAAEFAAEQKKREGRAVSATSGVKKSKAKPPAVRHNPSTGRWANPLIAPLRTKVAFGDN
jgi:ParB family chromosome partitioning protein